MKKEYEKPSMKIEMFEANEYIAACDTRCVNGTLYKDSNNNGIYDDSGDDKDEWKGTVLCNKDSHIDEVPQYAFNGFIVNYVWGKKKVTPVKGWHKPFNGWHAIPNHS